MKNPAHPHAEVIKAWADGAEIQFCVKGKWQDPDPDLGTPAFSADVPYRIKPRTETIHTKYGYRRYIGRNVFDDPIVALAIDNTPAAIERIEASESFVAWIDDNWLYHSAQIEVKS